GLRGICAVLAETGKPRQPGQDAPIAGLGSEALERATAMRRPRGSVETQQRELPDARGPEIAPWAKQLAIVRTDAA
ncbi:unnamed protein product, partial [Prorocentrum cordatum]